jgi:DNA-binding transcriptional LysR family regulator
MKQTRSRPGPLDRNAVNLPMMPLRALLLIERTGSLTQAAHALGISQPAVSKAIATLEADLGTSVLRRGMRPLRLTVAGDLLARHAERTSAIEAVTLKHLNDLRTHRLGLVRIGSFGASASTRILPDVLVRFARARPNITLQIAEGTDIETIAALRDGHVDVAVMIEPEGDEFMTLPLAADRLVALVGDQDPLAGRKRLCAADFQDRPFIMTKGGSEPIVRRWFARSGQEPRVDHDVQQLTSILALVRAGLGLSIIAELAIPLTHPGVTLVPLDPEAPRAICFARNRASLPSQAAETFWRYLEAWTEQI